MTQQEQAQFARKKRQRFIEYLVLIGFQGFFVTAFLSVLQPFLSTALAVASFGLSWNLARLREQRRLLETNDKRRLLGDALESLVLMLFLVCIGIGARYIQISFVVVMAHLSVSLIAYFLGSFLGESVWTRQFFSSLSARQQYNYIVNLNQSLLFPYNFSHLRRVFRSSQRDDDNAQE